MFECTHDARRALSFKGVHLHGVRCAMSPDFAHGFSRANTTSLPRSVRLSFVIPLPRGESAGTETMLEERAGGSQSALHSVGKPALLFPTQKTCDGTNNHTADPQSTALAPSLRREVQIMLALQTSQFNDPRATSSIV